MLRILLEHQAWSFVKLNQGFTEPKIFLSKKMRDPLRIFHPHNFLPSVHTDVNQNLQHKNRSPEPVFICRSGCRSKKSQRDAYTPVRCSCLRKQVIDAAPVSKAR
jgi:hypothetical protein